MPDMDGFKLLELVGLEMDLPVIMLSSNGDTDLVMKGVTHGACDYLVKPVRIQELKNIWQHVVRRKKVDSKDQANSENQDKSHIGSCGGGVGNLDQNVKLNKKRKDQKEDEDDNRDEDGYDNEDPSTQKKPRVVWSVDLHRKFVAAVNKLGIDKAVPKKILDLMNEEKLTRENVASHLQKFRLYLKRISCVANQQVNMMAALGSSDSSYLQMGSFNGVRNYHALTGPGPGFGSIPLNGVGVIGRVNTPTGLGLHCLPSSGQKNISNSILDQGIFPGNHRNGSMLQANLEIDQRHRKPVGDLSAAISSVLPDAKLRSGDGAVARDFEVSVAPLKSEISAPFLDHGRLNDSWSQSSSAFRSMRSCQFDVPCSQLQDPRPEMPISTDSDPFQGWVWVDHKQGSPYPSMDSLMPANVPVAFDHNLDSKGTTLQRNMDFNSIGQSDFHDPMHIKFDEVERSMEEASMNLKAGYVMDQRKPQGGLVSNNYGSLDDLVSAMTNQLVNLA